MVNKQIRQHISTFGYIQVSHTHGLFRHKTRTDYFGVKYSNLADLDHLRNALKARYTTTSDITGTLYCGLTLKWEYQLRYVDMSMQGYVNKVLQRFTLPSLFKPHHSPHAHVYPKYGTRIQHTGPPDISPPLSPKETTTVQEIIGTLLCYDRAVDLTLYVDLGTLGSVQTKQTTITALGINRLLMNVVSHPGGTIQNHTSDMVLHIQSDTSYLSETGVRSRAGGCLFLSNNLFFKTKAPSRQP